MIQIKKSSPGHNRGELAKNSTILAEGSFKNQLFSIKLYYSWILLALIAFVSTLNTTSDICLS